MKSEIPPSTTIAPIAIAIALPPLRPLLDPEVDEVELMIVGVVAVGIVAAGWGKPGESAFDGPGVIRFGVDPWARALPGNAIAATIAAAAIRPRTAYASGCSIAGVSGASTYGCSSSTSSSW
jgi:hypothetical protein